MSRLSTRMPRIPRRSARDGDVSAFEQRPLIVLRGRRVAEVSVRDGRGGAPARRALQEAVLHEEGLVDLLDRARVLANRRCDRVDADRAALELLDDALENA